MASPVPSDPLPPLDRELSPVTGWTRAHWEALADRILARAQADATPGHGRVVPRTSLAARSAVTPVDQLEGFSRTFLLAALRVAQPGADPVQEELRQQTIDWWARGVASGTDPSHADAWPVIEDHDQTMVEAAAVAVALHWSRATVWDRLDDSDRERVIGWLATSRDKTCAENNHVLFLATVQAFLASVGADHDRGQIEAALATIEAWYRGDGWYTDGFGRRFDHYNAFTFHLYPWLIDEMLATTGARPGQWRGRLRAFLDGYRSLVDIGTPVLQGRSLVYRWGLLAPFWLGTAIDATPLSPGATRCLASRVVSGFVADGVASDGRLSLGWRGRDCDPLLQTYTMAGSPHWASKGMLGLLLPSDHPAWTEPEPRPVPATVTPLRAPGWLVDSRRGVTRLLNHGSDGHPRHDNAWYRRLAFSDATVPIEIDGFRDSSIVATRPGVTWVDRGLRGGLVGPDWACSRRIANLGESEVLLDVVSVVLDGAELRVARMSGVAGCGIRVTGYALASDDRVAVGVVGGSPVVSTGAGLVSSVRPVRVGTDRTWAASTPITATDTALGSHVGLPCVESAADNDVVTVGVVVSLARADASGPGSSEPLVTLTEEGVLVTWDTVVRAVPWPPTQGWPGDTIGQGVWTPWPRRESC